MTCEDTDHSRNPSRIFEYSCSIRTLQKHSPLQNVPQRTEMLLFVRRLPLVRMQLTLTARMITTVGAHNYRLVFLEPDTWAWWLGEGLLELGNELSTKYLQWTQQFFSKQKFYKIRNKRKKKKEGRGEKNGSNFKDNYNLLIFKITRIVLHCSPRLLQTFMPGGHCSPVDV